MLNTEKEKEEKVRAALEEEGKVRRQSFTTPTLNHERRETPCTFFEEQVPVASGGTPGGKGGTDARGDGIKELWNQTWKI